MKPNVPIIVASQSFLNQAGAFARTTIFTAPADGVFRVSQYCDFSPSVISGSFAPVAVPMFFTDDFGQLQLTPSETADNGPDNHGASSLTWFVKMKQGTSLVLGPNGGPNAGVTYNVYVTVEDLN